MERVQAVVVQLYDVHNGAVPGGQLHLKTSVTDPALLSIRFATDLTSIRAAEQEIGSPDWTRFELLQPKFFSARTASTPL